mmetsp:Transcript_73877/g.238781  ORF Transcript_73877/g.238781 Transcript_73877/m.238781 type:complete len:220 (-) Transcript_73877:58-717(-)
MKMEKCSVSNCTLYIAQPPGLRGSEAPVGPPRPGRGLRGAPVALRLAHAVGLPEAEGEPGLAVLAEAVVHRLQVLPKLRVHQAPGFPHLLRGELPVAAAVARAPLGPVGAQDGGLRAEQLPEAPRLRGPVGGPARSRRGREAPAAAAGASWLCPGRGAWCRRPCPILRAAPVVADLVARRGEAHRQLVVRVGVSNVEDRSARKDGHRTLRADLLSTRQR